jgi:flagellar assembly protein FliH
LSSIVKAKWVTQVIEAPPALKDPGVSGELSEMGESSQENQEQQISEADSVDAMRSANELMKEAIKASQEIKEKSQEDGYRDGFAQGYAAGHEVGFQEGTQEGFQRGLKEGLSEGLAQAEAQIAQKFFEIEEVLLHLQQERQMALATQEQNLLEIAFEIAKKIMKQQIHENPDAFLKIFDEVIHGDEEDLKIYLSDNQKTLDLHIDKEMAEKLKKLSKKSKVIMLKDEDKIMVETKDSVIDMSLPVQLEQLEKAIEESS